MWLRSKGTRCLMPHCDGLTIAGNGAGVDSLGRRESSDGSWRRVDADRALSTRRGDYPYTAQTYAVSSSCSLRLNYLHVGTEKIYEGADARRKMLVTDIDCAKGFGVAGIEIFQYRNEAACINIRLNVKSGQAS